MNFESTSGQQDLMQQFFRIIMNNLNTFVFSSISDSHKSTMKTFFFNFSKIPAIIAFHSIFLNTQKTPEEGRPTSAKRHRRIFKKVNNQTIG